MRIIKQLRFKPSVQIVEDDDNFRLLVFEGGEIPAGADDQCRALQVRMVIDVEGRRLRFWEEEEWFPYVTEGVPSYAEARRDHQPSAPPRKSGFVHLHAHSEFSSLDGLSTVREMVEQAVADGQMAIAVTDHGNCAAHPYLQKEADAAGIKPILGIETYFVDDRLRRPKGLPKGVRKSELPAAELEAYERDNAEVKDYWHLILIAKNDVGLRNIWAMSTTAHVEGYYGHPRVDWELLARHSEGVICTTACLKGPISQAILSKDMATAELRLYRLQEIFKDDLYMEIHTNTEPEQRGVNEALVRLSQETGVRLLAVSDSHYSCHDHKKAHKVWMSAQTGKTVNDDVGMFGSDSNYHILTEDEVRQALSYLPDTVVKESIDNTLMVANQCRVRIWSNPDPPSMNKGDRSKDDDDLIELVKANVPRKIQRKIGNDPALASTYLARIDREFSLVKSKQFSGYFLMVANYCNWAKDHGILVGPARGSGGGSLLAYLCGITEVDPVEHDLMFERFMTEGRTELPDFDVDFPTSRIDEVYQYIIDKWGEDHVVRVGTHLRLKSKSVVRKLASALKGDIDVDWADIEKISRIVDRAESGEAGLGLTWEKLWTRHKEELEPYRLKYPVLFDYADLFVGRLNAYGKHAAGVVVSPEESLSDRLPMRMGDDGRLISEYDMKALANMGLVKLDLLGLRTLDTVQKCIDLIAERTGVVISPYEWSSEFYDKDVWDYLSAGNTLGCFQIETSVGTKMTREVRPENLKQLADVITLDRPGPTRSGLDRVYLNRKHGRERITHVDDRLKDILSGTYGVMIYQENIMNIFTTLGGYTQDEADKVRKILGKKEVDEARPEIAKFVEAAIRNGMEPESAQSLGTLMAEFAKYSFNQAHALGYAIITYWTAWLKFHYPREFYVALLSTVDQKRISDIVVDARSRGYRVLPPDINQSKADFSVVDKGILFGFSSIKGIGFETARLIEENQPYASVEDLRSRVISNRNGGVKKLASASILQALNRCGALESLYPNRRKLEDFWDRDSVAGSARCKYRNDENSPLPCDFDWSSEEPIIGKRGIALKPKPVPKKCTVACRNFTFDPLDDIEVEPWSKNQIRDFEMEYLWTHLSSTPFDPLLERYGDVIKRASEMEAYDFFNQMATAGIVSRVAERTDRNGKTFGLISMFAQDGMIDGVCFHDAWSASKKFAKPGNLVIAIMKKTDRGYQFSALEPSRNEG